MYWDPIECARKLGWDKLMIARLQDCFYLEEMIPPSL